MFMSFLAMARNFIYGKYWSNSEKFLELARLSLEHLEYS